MLFLLKVDQGLYNDRDTTDLIIPVLWLRTLFENLMKRLSKLISRGKLLDKIAINSLHTICFPKRIFKYDPSQYNILKSGNLLQGVPIVHNSNKSGHTSGNAYTISALAKIYKVLIRGGTWICFAPAIQISDFYTSMVQNVFCRCTQ